MRELRRCSEPHPHAPVKRRHAPVSPRAGLRRSRRSTTIARPSTALPPTDPRGGAAPSGYVGGCDRSSRAPERGCRARGSHRRAPSTASGRRYPCRVRDELGGAHRRHLHVAERVAEIAASPRAPREPRAPGRDRRRARDVLKPHRLRSHSRPRRACVSLRSMAPSRRTPNENGPRRTHPHERLERRARSLERAYGLARLVALGPLLPEELEPPSFRLTIAMRSSGATSAATSATAAWRRPATARHAGRRRDAPVGQDTRAEAAPRRAGGNATRRASGYAAVTGTRHVEQRRSPR